MHFLTYKYITLLPAMLKHLFTLVFGIQHASWNKPLSFFKAIFTKFQK